MPAALEDLLVLDLSRVLAGPYATQMLGDLGAQVIKVEAPDRPDETRQWGPPFTADGMSAYFLCANRNKAAITLDLKQPDGQALLRDLVRRADVLIENFRVGTLDRLGLGYEDLRAINPGLIYCAISGYGTSGPDAGQPGYDTVIQAQGGLMSITGPADGEPSKVGVAVVDITAGLYAASSILAALHYRTQSGVGQRIDIALFDVQLAWLANVAQSYLLSGRPPQRYGNAHATIVPYQPFPTADRPLMIAVGNDDQFARLCAALGAPEWADDPRFRSNPARVAQREALVALISTRMAGQSAEHWLPLLRAADVPCAPINDIPAALADRQTLARGLVETVTLDNGEAVRLIGPAAQLSATPARIRSAPPAHGRDTDRVLHEILGYNQAQIDRLRALGVI